MTRNPKFYALLTLSLVAVATLPMVGGRGFALVPAVMAQSTDAREAEADRLLQQGFQQFQTSQFTEALQSWEKALQIYREIKNRRGEAASLGNLGQTYLVLGQYQKAIEYHQQYLTVGREIAARQWEADSLGNLGVAYGSLGQYQKAIEYLQQSLDIAREIKDQWREAKALGDLGNTYQSLGQYRKAIEYHQQSLTIAREIQYRQGEADSLNNLGAAYNFLGQYQKAIEYYQKSLDIAREGGYRSTEANALSNLGVAYNSLGQYQKAIECLQQSLDIAREGGYRSTEANALSNLGVAYNSLGQYQKALEYQQKSLAIAREIKDQQGEASALGSLGYTYLVLGQYQKAIECLQQSLDIAREGGYRSTEANSLGNLGVAYNSLGQYQKAIEFHRQSLAIAREIKDRREEANSRNNLGNAYYSLGQYQKAIDYQQQSLDINREIQNRQGEAASLVSVGNVYYSLGEYQKAIKYQQQSLAISREIQNRQGEAASLGNLGNAYQSLGQYQKAIDYHQKSLAINREIGTRSGEANALGNLGNAYQSLGQYQKAIDYQQQSLDINREIQNRQGEAASLGNLGNAYDSLGQYQKAIEYQQKHLEITREIGDRSGEALSLNNLGAAYRDNKQPAEAITNLEASLTIYLDTRGQLSRGDRKQFLASNERTVITLAEVFIQQNQPEKAFEWLNLATTADLADYNRLIDAKVANLEAQKALDNWNANNRQLEGMRRQLQDKFSEELAKEIREFETKVYGDGEAIARKYPEVAELFETKPTDITRLRQNIAPDTLVIQPVPLRDKVALFLLTREKLTVIQSDTKRNEFNQLVSQYRRQLADYQNADVYATGGKLYEILIRPIELQIAASSSKNIAIIATEQLRYIPFETLYDEKTEKFFLQKYSVSYLTRISATTPPTTERKPLQVLAFANPKPTRQELKGTEIEADIIQQTFPSSVTYEHEKATLDIFKTQAARFSILHLGTHGCFNQDGCPDLGMKLNTILFANNQQYPIADAALLGLKNTELITLSACQTAKEANADGQEISGLAYVLERAGARSVIASLWSVEDSTSAEIMTKFYQNLQKGMSKSEAMRQAKLSQIQQHPYFWSPFILIGDAR
jgi:tetratricopeptide (TPR) repeat protein